MLAVVQRRFEKASKLFVAVLFKRLPTALPTRRVFSVLLLTKAFANVIITPLLTLPAFSTRSSSSNFEFCSKSDKTIQPEGLIELRPRFFSVVILANDSTM